MQTCANGNAVSYIIEAKENPETNYRRVMLTFFNLQKADVVTKEEAESAQFVNLELFLHDRRAALVDGDDSDSGSRCISHEGDQDDGMVISMMLSISGVQDACSGPALVCVRRSMHFCILHFCFGDIV